MGLTLLLKLTLLLLAKPVKSSERYTFPILFWNVENLFDCIDNPLTEDDEFLPTSLKRWSYTRYRAKLNAIAKTIAAVNRFDPPVLIGLCEVESDSTLYYLTQRSILKPLNYRYIITDSKDSRGLNIGLLYLRERFKPLSTHFIGLDKLQSSRRTTRDILHVKGLILSGDTLDLFITHLPSRYGGKKHSEPNRIEIAQLLASTINKLTAQNKQAKVVVMGDFNDTPKERSLQQVLKVSYPEEGVESNKLYHLLSSSKYNYTYKYRGEWTLIDHILVTGNLLDRESKFYSSPDSTKVVRLPFLLTADEKYGGKKPSRTYQGMKYLGGYSDHLPILSLFTEIIEE